MASSGVSVLRELSAQFLECGICNGTFKEPRDLKCMHTFCLQCVTFLSEDQPKGSKTVVCPTCKTPTDIPDGGISTLQRNRMLETLLEKITSHTKKLLQNSCSRHEGRELALFCRKCDVGICHVCAVENHPNPEHDYVPLTQVVKEHREGCSEHLRNIADEIVRDERNLKIARRKSAILREKKDEVESNIRAAAEEVMQLIKIREQELGEELDCVLETREDEVAIYCGALERKLKDSRNMMGDLRDILDCGDDTAMVKKYGEIRQKNAHKMPLAPVGLRFVTFKRDEEGDAISKDNLGCLKEVMIPWNEVTDKIKVVENGGGVDVGGGKKNGTQQQGESKGKKEKSEKEASEKAQNNKEGGHGGKVKENNGRKPHPSQLPPTPPASPRNSGVFTIGPAQVFLKPTGGGSGGGGGSSGGGSSGGGGGGKHTLSPSSDIFGTKHHHRSPKETRKGIRIVDPNSNEDITELIMGDNKNRTSQKAKKRGPQQQQQQQQQQQKLQQHQQELTKPEG